MCCCLPGGILWVCYVWFSYYRMNPINIMFSLAHPWVFPGNMPLQTFGYNSFRLTTVHSKEAQIPKLEPGCLSAYLSISYGTELCWGPTFSPLRTYSAKACEKCKPEASSYHRGVQSIIRKHPPKTKTFNFFLTKQVNWSSSYLFWSLPCYLVSEGGISALGVVLAEHRTHDLGQMRLAQLTGHIHSQPGGGGHWVPCMAMWGLPSWAQWLRGALGGRFYSKDRMRGLLILKGGCDRLVWIILRADRGLKPITQG